MLKMLGAKNSILIPPLNLAKYNSYVAPQWSDQKRLICFQSHPLNVRVSILKHSRRFVRNKSFKQSHHRQSDDFGSLKPKIHDDGHKFSKTRRKSEMENVIQQIELNNTGEVRNRANLTQLLNSGPDLAVLKSLVTETTKALSKSEDEADFTVKKKRIHPHGRLAGRAKAACDSCGIGYNGNSGQTECPSNLENMFVCPKCRTHFVVRIHIKESKGCES